MVQNKVNDWKTRKENEGKESELISDEKAIKDLSNTVAQWYKTTQRTVLEAF